MKTITKQLLVMLIIFGLAACKKDEAVTPEPTLEEVLIASTTWKIKNVDNLATLYIAIVPSSEVPKATITSGSSIDVSSQLIANGNMDKQLKSSGLDKANITNLQRLYDNFSSSTYDNEFVFGKDKIILENPALSGYGSWVADIGDPNFYTTPAASSLSFLLIGGQGTKNMSWSVSPDSKYITITNASKPAPFNETVWYVESFKVVNNAQSEITVLAKHSMLTPDAIKLGNPAISFYVRMTLRGTK